MRLGVMCSGNGTNFENIVRTCRHDEVVIMIHNKEKCGAAKRADKLGIPHTHIKSKNEDLIIDVMKAWNVDPIVLAVSSVVAVSALPVKLPTIVLALTILAVTG